MGSGVGTAALQLAKVAGATVIGTSRCGGEGVHAILDLVGGAYVVGDLECLAEEGRLIIVGLTAGRTAEIDIGVLLRKRLRLIGTSLRNRPIEEKIGATRAFEHDVGPLLASGQVRPIIDRVFPFDEVVAAHRHMESNLNFGKRVSKMPPK